MTWLAKVRFHLRTLFARRKLDEQLSEEVRAHVEMATEKNISKGLPPDEAHYAALREFGNVARIQEQAREGRGWLWVEQGVQDAFYAFRQIARSKGFAAVTVLTLALGIGASTVLFSVLNSVFLRSLPVKDPGGLFMLGATGPSRIGNPFTHGYYEHFRQHSTSFQAVAAMGFWPGFRALTRAGGDAGDAEELMTFEVSASYFTTMGVRASVGRLFDQGDDAANAPAVAVISHELWRRRFAADPSIVGCEILLDRFPVTVIGVAAPAFSGAVVGARADLWLPARLSPQIDQNQPWGAGGLAANYPLFNIAVRLRPGVSQRQAEAELTGLFQQQVALPAGLPPWQKALEGGDVLQSRIELQPLGRGYGGIRNWLYRPVVLLAGMVTAALLVACANIAGLLLVRGSAREREFAMRAALGASRSRIVRQILVESLALALLGGVAATLVVWGGTYGLGRFLEVVDLAPDIRVLTFAVGMTLITGLIFGLLPARRLSRLDLVSPGKQGTGPSSRMSRGLVVVQIALAFVLCSGAALIVRTFRNVAGIETGFRPAQLLVAPLTVDRSTAPKQRFEIEHRLRQACLVLPGVRSATFQQGWSLIGGTRARAESAHDIRDSLAPDAKPVPANRVTVGPDFFSTMQIPLLHGGGFHGADSAENAPPKVVLSEFAARRVFGERNPIGQRVKLWKDFEVVGVAADVKVATLREEPRLVVYLPLQASPSTLQTTLVIRTEPSARLALDDLRAVLRRIDPTASLARLTPVDDILVRQVRTERLLAQLAASFALFVLLLACVGLFGLLAFSVTRRTKEIGVRMALGASPRGLLVSVIREGMGLVLAGAVVGLVCAASLVRFVESLLYGISPTEPGVYLTVMAALGGAAFLACWLPARRASKVDPMVALRAE